MTAAEGKEFLISRIIAEAKREGVPLTDTEQEMLWWTEVHPEPHIPDLKRLAERFDDECDSDEYEEKIRALATGARDQAAKASPAQEQRWKEAVNAIGKEDHYLNVMLPVSSASVDDISDEPPPPHPIRDYLIYFTVGIALVGAIVLLAEFTN